MKQILAKETAQSLVILNSKVQINDLKCNVHIPVKCKYLAWLKITKKNADLFKCHKCFRRQSWRRDINLWAKFPGFNIPLTCKNTKLRTRIFLNWFQAFENLVTIDLLNKSLPFAFKASCSCSLNDEPGRAKIAPYLRSIIHILQWWNLAQLYLNLKMVQNTY